KTPHQYLTQVRIDHAKLLLQQPTPISHVCSAVGFDSVTSFTGLFKKYTGQSPSEFQQRQLQRQTDISCVPLKFVPNCFVHPEGDSNK
ncbi:MAG: helix-turn-helix transcriptional regulator, partial [Cyclobacteriaceae bacterium]|nr:helix-turn-helix transcriptional regulator [Cyclobacteriaceae bacterium]